MPPTGAAARVKHQERLQSQFLNFATLYRITIGMDHIYIIQAAVPPFAFGDHMVIRNRFARIKLASALGTWKRGVQRFYHKNL